MTRATNARIAGFTFLIYIAVGITSMVLTARATTGTGVAAQLATIAQHETDVRLTILLTLVMNLSALVLGVAWLGVAASVLLVVCCPLVLAGLLRGPITTYMWLPMLLFEVVLALWLIIKGVTLPSDGRHRSAGG
jgi:hypothetical protein